MTHKNTAVQIEDVRISASGEISGYVICGQSFDSPPEVMITERQVLRAWSLVSGPPQARSDGQQRWTFSAVLPASALDGRQHDFRFFVTGVQGHVALMKLRTPFPAPGTPTRPVFIPDLDWVKLLTEHRRLSKTAGNLPADFEITLSKAHLALVNGSSAQARLLINSLGDVAIRRPVVQLRLAECDLLDGQPESAARRFFEIAKLLPNFGWAYIGLIDALAAQQKWDDAEIVCRKVEALTEQPAGFQWRQSRLSCLRAVQDDVALLSDPQRADLLLRIKQLLLLLPEDRQLSRALERLRQPAGSLIPDSWPSDSQHHRLVLELVCDTARVAHG